MKITIYDPPSGWMYGFPKQYIPRDGEPLEETLRRDGYPERMMNLSKYTRFWEQDTSSGNQATQVETDDEDPPQLP